MRYWLIGALALALMACGEDAEENGWDGAPSAPGVWAPSVCPTSGVEDGDDLAVGSFEITGFDGAGLGAERLSLGDMSDLPVPFTWRPSVEPGGCVGAVYEMRDNIGGLLKRGRVIVSHDPAPDPVWADAPVADPSTRNVVTWMPATCPTEEVGIDVTESGDFALMGRVTFRLPGNTRVVYAATAANGNPVPEEWEPDVAGGCLGTTWYLVSGEKTVAYGRLIVF